MMPRDLDLILRRSHGGETLVLVHLVADGKRLYNRALVRRLLGGPTDYEWPIVNFLGSDVSLYWAVMECCDDEERTCEDERGRTCGADQRVRTPK